MTDAVPSAADFIELENRIAKIEDKMENLLSRHEESMQTLMSKVEVCSVPIRIDDFCCRDSWLRLNRVKIKHRTSMQSFLISYQSIWSSYIALIVHRKCLSASQMVLGAR